MEIKREENLKVKCDFGGCKNKAKYSIKLKTGFFSADTYLCEDCFKLLYESMGKFLTPTSPSNLLKKKKEKKLDE